MLALEYVFSCHDGCSAYPDGTIIWHDIEEESDAYMESLDG